MKRSVIIANCALFFCAFPIAFGAGNTIPTLPHEQASQETLASPRLAALQKELAVGNRAALEIFWQAVTKRGAPTGLLENLSVARPDSPTNLIASRHLRDVLQAKGYEVRLQEINGGHDFFNWQAALPDGLTPLLNTKKEK